MEKKLIIIGIDGATFDFIKPLSEIGKLPNITKLMKNGAFSEMKSTIPPLTAIAWPSFFTGVNPGKHGIFDFINFKLKGIGDCLNNYSSIQTKTLWDYTHDNSLKSIIVNVPMTYPPKKYENNTIISGVLTPGDEAFCSNGDIKKEIEREFGNFLCYHNIFEKYKSLKGIKKLETTKDLLWKKDEQIKDISIYLLKKYDPDILITVFISVDHIKHLMWSYQNKNNIFHKKFGDCIEKTYIKIDEYVGDILNNNDNADIVIISDHGWGDINHVVFVNSILNKKNLLEFQRGDNEGSYVSWQNKIKNEFVKKKEKSGIINMERLIRLVNKYNMIKFFGKLPFKYRIYNIFSILSKKEIKGRKFKVNFNKSKAWLTSKTSFSICINSKDRNEHGKIVKDIKEEFHKLKCKKCGESLIGEVFEKNELYWGKNIDNAPDIIIIPKNYNTISATSSNDGETTVQHLDNISGWHKLNGIFIASGPNIKNNSINPTIYDIVPTVLNYFNLPIPVSIDGKALDIFRDLEPKYKEINIYKNIYDV